MVKKEFYANSEGVKIPICPRSFDEAHGITLCCVIMNEEKEIKEFLEYHRPYFKTILMIDGGSIDRTIEIATPLVDEIHLHKFDGHYSNQVNRITEKVKTDWVIFLDCDERLEKPIMENLNKLIDQEEFDCYSFPRKNYIDGVLDSEDPINYQERLHRSYCRRIRPVHGEIVGYKNKKILPEIDGNFIIHKKIRARHVSRNLLYLIFELKFRHEIGEPGNQLEKSFDREYPKLNISNFKVM